jgi:hypothetical protein
LTIWKIHYTAERLAARPPRFSAAGCSGWFDALRKLDCCSQLANDHAADEIAPPTKASDTLPVCERLNIDFFAVDQNEFINELHVERKPMSHLIPDTVQEFDRWH